MAMVASACWRRGAASARAGHRAAPRVVELQREHGADHRASHLRQGRRRGSVTRRSRARHDQRDAEVCSQRWRHRNLVPATQTHSTVLDFSACKIYILSVAPAPPSSAQPIGMKVPDDRMIAQQVSSARYPSLLHSLLAVVLAESGSCDDLLRASASGFVHVTQVDTERQKITLLAPAPITRTSLFLLSGAIKWSPE